jgi:hypothetical protein
MPSIWKKPLKLKKSKPIFNFLPVHTPKQQRIVFGFTGPLIADMDFLKIRFSPGNLNQWIMGQ